mmetsp:Transcript_117450/g.278868  ORF Transcript_117450/g.278868 Transcript_117450/m.278868 type:complete len:215 (+) Transcript_117450:1253-1897(+)
MQLLRQTLQRPEEEELPAAYYHDPVEQVENLGGGLVDGAKHIAAVLVGEVLQPPDHVVRSIGIQARGGLIQENELGLHDQLNAHAGPLLLAPGDATDHVIPHEGVCALLETQVLQHPLHHLQLVLRGIGLRKPQIRREPQGLPHRLGRGQDVLLHHVGNALAKGRATHLLPIQLDVALHSLPSAGADASCQHVQQGGLASSGGAHQRADLATLQ